MYKPNTYILTYYSVLLLLVLLRTSMSAPPLAQRIAFILLLFLPLYMKHIKLFPSVLLCFVTINIYGYAFGFLPYELGIYVIFAFIAFFLNNNIKSIPIHLLPVIILTTIVLLVDLFDSGSLQNVFYAAMTVLLCASLSKEHLPIINFSLLYSFTIISFSLSSLYIINYEKFLTDYNAIDGLQRSGWIDPNYFSCIIGMGALASLIILFTTSTAHITKLLLVVSIVFSVVAQLLMASRGGLLALSVGAFIVLAGERLSFIGKVAVTSLVIIFAFILQQFGAYKLIAYRIENDSGGGSGRLDIWTNKLSEFYNTLDLPSFMFGVGYQSGGELGVSTGNVGFHNDFLAIFCCYGLIGFILFMYTLLQPIACSRRDKRTGTLALTSYLLLCLLTLEPFRLGQLPYFFFLFLIYTYSKTSSPSPHSCIKYSL